MQSYMVYKGKEMIVEDVGKADHFFARFKGLMFRKSMDMQEGLWIKPCSQVHTFNMRFPIDVIFLDCDNRILYIEHEMKPHRVSKMVARSRSVLELCAGRAANCRLETGDVLSFRIECS